MRYPVHCTVPKLDKCDRVLHVGPMYITGAGEVRKFTRLNCRQFTWARHSRSLIIIMSERKMVNEVFCSFSVPLESFPFSLYLPFSLTLSNPLYVNRTFELISPWTLNITVDVQKTYPFLNIFNKKSLQGSVTIKTEIMSAPLVLEILASKPIGKGHVRTCFQKRHIPTRGLQLSIRLRPLFDNHTTVGQLKQKA